MKKIANLVWVAGAAVFLMSACNSGPQNAHEQAVDPALEVKPYPFSNSE